MLDPTLLSAFINTFYGYGTWNAPYWFIGMEEGGGNEAEQIATRLNVWNHRGQRELEDLHDYHEATGITRHSGASAKLQSTWSKLVRIILAANGQSAETEAVRRYQGTRLGRSDGESALIELLPLPSPSTLHWLYAKTGIDILRDRDTYRAALIPERASRIRERIAEHRPESVVFYSTAYREAWQSIAGVTFTLETNGRFEAGEANGTQFFLVKHPVARGVRNTDFEAIGKMIASKWGQQLSRQEDAVAHRVPR